MLQGNSQNIHRLCLEEYLGETNFEYLLENPLVLHSMEQYQEAAAIYLERNPVEEVVSRARSKSASSVAVTDTSSHNNSLFMSRESYERPEFQMNMGYDMETQKVQKNSMRNQTVGSSERNIYQVQFKHNFRDYTTAPGEFLPINMGSFVVVRSDYGQDIGVVTHIQSMNQYVANKSLRKFSNTDEEDEGVGLILSIATLQQRQFLPVKLKKEGKVMKNVLRFVHEVFKLPMKIVGVEYQADGLKLTIHYVADVHIDFRDLVKELFAIFRVRIWMRKCDPNVAFVPKKFAVLSLTTGTSHEDNWEKHV